MHKMIVRKLSSDEILSFILLSAGGFLIVYLSNLGVFIGVFLFVWGNNILHQNFLDNLNKANKATTTDKE